MYVGLGYDIHPLKKGRRFMLGGVEIRSPLGPVGHSDGDALLHAICDALLGAAGYGDIGMHFPAKAEFQNISGLTLLDRVTTLLTKNSYKIGHLDTIVILERPRLGPYRTRIIRRIAKGLGVLPRKVSFKAKTNDGLGLLGKERAVAAFAIASLIKKKRKRRKHV